MASKNGAVKTVKAGRPAIVGSVACAIKRAAGPVAKIGRTADTIVSRPAGGAGALENWYPGVVDGYRPGPGAGAADIAARLTAYAAARRAGR